MARITKAMVYKSHGIEFKDGKILSPIGWINPLLKDGNTKTGYKVKTFSTLPTNKEYHAEFNGIKTVLNGTCPCHCKECYATKGMYNCPSCINSLALNTYLCKYHLDFVERAIIAQIKADKITLCRIHASGDFMNDEYAYMWKRIVAMFTNCAFWTYTKVSKYESLFDGLKNAKIVKSVIKGFGFNYGHCGYILTVYRALIAQGKRVYICRCGIDKNQHCANCHGCLDYEYVLFVEHSTEYVAENDKDYEELKAVIESQEKQY
ncbi:MAG: hypothetical protein J6W09_04410 [Bacteroidales bacterium]|nr:hypothetical protein [Bacteroidales bacterium]